MASISELGWMTWRFMPGSYVWLLPFFSSSLFVVVLGGERKVIHVHVDLLQGNHSLE